MFFNRFLHASFVNSHPSASIRRRRRPGSVAVAVGPQRVQTLLVPPRDPPSRHLALAFGHLLPIRDSTQASARAHCVVTPSSVVSRSVGRASSVETSRAPTMGPR